MSEWIKLHAGVFTHPKTRRLAKRLSIPPAAAAGHMACLWSFTAEFAPDGDLGSYDHEEIELGAGWDGEDGKFIAAAVAAGYLDKSAKSLQIHDWSDYGGKLVERKAAERKRSADRRATAGRTTDDQSTTDGRPLAERERDREIERTPPTPPAVPKPVDMCTTPERGCSIEQEEEPVGTPGDAEGDPPAGSHGATTSNAETCDGHPCAARQYSDAASAALRSAMRASLHPQQQKQVGKPGPLDDKLTLYAEHVCQACQVALAEYERPQRDALCERALVSAVESLKGSGDVSAVITSRLVKQPDLLILIGDRQLEELRRTKRDKQRQSEPLPIGATLPPIPRAEQEAS